MPDWQSAANLVKKIAENHRLPYYTLSPTYSICPTHGYINGEVRTCPDCGRATELYSRITGYYRPVQNWNDGKAQEYQDRREYDIGSSNVRPLAERDQEAVRAKEDQQVGDLSSKHVLFTTSTCPNCTVSKADLRDSGIDYLELNVKDHLELARQFGVMQAPTLLVKEDNQVRKIINASNIKQYISDLN